MQGKSAKLFLSATTILALVTVRPLWGQQAGGQIRKLTPSPAATMYEDTEWSSNRDIQLLKSDIRSQKKQIVAANMDLTDTEAEKFWPVYDRYATDLAKIYDTKIALFQEYLENGDTMWGTRRKTTCVGALPSNRTRCSYDCNTRRNLERCLPAEKQHSFIRSNGDSI